MSNVYRYIEGARTCIPITIASGVTVEIGDLMFIDNEDNLRINGSSTANNCAYPLEYLRISGASLELNKREVKERFIGVSMDYHSGITNEDTTRTISVAISGKFNFHLKPAKTVYPGSYVGVTGTSSGSNIINQKVMRTDDSLIRIGTFAEYKKQALNADLEIQSFLRGTL